MSLRPEGLFTRPNALCMILKKRAAHDGELVCFGVSESIGSPVVKGPVKVPSVLNP